VMGEYGDPAAVQRLAGGPFGGEGLLTARVREQPFGVLLLDEFEKAHPLFFDLLLQVLGEGRLTDAAGRLADFTNTVIILTSNLGAESYQQGSFGFGGTTGAEEAARRQAAREHFVRAVQDFVRPELLAPLAHGLNRHGTEFALSADVTLEDGALRCAVKPRTDAAGRPLPAGASSTGLAAAAALAVELRRDVQALERCRALREF